jgi:menaquinone-9 beta-reductase
MPDGVAALERLGVPLAGLGRPFAGISWLQEGAAAGGRFPGAAGLGLRREALHRALVARAEEVGVELRWGEPAQALVEGRVETARGLLAPAFVVAADGLGSRVRRWAGLEGRPGRRRRFGMRRHYRLPPWSDAVEVTWGDRAEAYVTPVADHEVGVALLWSGPAPQGFDGLLTRFPTLAERLRGAVPCSRDQGAGPFHRRARSVVAGNLALVGDAGGYLDAVTGEGVGLAAQQAEALAAALAAGDLRPYAAAHRRLVRLPNALTALLLMAQKRPALRRRLVAFLAAEPALFSRLLAIHSRQAGLSSLGALAPARLLLALCRPT